MELAVGSLGTQLTSEQYTIYLLEDFYLDFEASKQFLIQYSLQFEQFPV